MTHGIDFITVSSTFIVLSATVIGLGVLPWTDEAVKASSNLLGALVALMGLVALLLLVIF